MKLPIETKDEECARLKHPARAERDALAVRVARLESLLAHTLPHLPITPRTRHDQDASERAALNAEIRAALTDQS